MVKGLHSIEESVCISKNYQLLLQEVEKQKKGQSQKEACAYLQEKFKSAMWLMRSLEHRKKTIHKVSEIIIQRQQEFFRKGESYLRPMTLRDVAEDLEVHISTISRAINGKHIQTPLGTFEFKHFFGVKVESTGANKKGFSIAAVKARIQEMVAAEDPESPLSDQELADGLAAEAGIKVSRRAVSRYRTFSGILAQHKRRKGDLRDRGKGDLRDRGKGDSSRDRDKASERKIKAS